MNIRRIIKVSFFTALLPLLSFAVDLPGQRITPISNFRLEDAFGLAGTIVDYILRAVGIVAIVMLIYAGFLFMTGAGNEEKIGKAKDLLKYSLIGIAVVILSFSAIAFMSSIITSR